MKTNLSKYYQENKRIVIIAAAAVVILLIAVVSLGNCKGGAFGKPLGVDESFDSVVAILPKKSQIIARYPDEARHNMYYLNSGTMYCFDGKTKLMEQVVINNVPDAYIEKTELSEDEQYITLWVTAGEKKMLFRLNSMNGNIVDISEQRPADKDEIKTDEQQTVTPSVKKEEPAATEEGAPQGGDVPAIDAIKTEPADPAQTTPPAQDKTTNISGNESSE